MDKIFINSNIYRAVEKCVDLFLSSLSPDVDPSTMEIISHKYHNLGASLVEDAYLLSRDTVRYRPWLPLTLVEDIVRTINSCGIGDVLSSDRDTQSVSRPKA